MIFSNRWESKIHVPNHQPKLVASNNVPLVKIEGPVWYTIYHHLPVVKGLSEETPLFCSPMGIWDIYGSRPINYHQLDLFSQLG